MNIIKKIKNKLLSEKIHDYNVTITRSIVHKKRIAPKGCVFLVAKATTKTGTWTLPIVIYTQGMTNEQELKLHQELKTKLINDITKAA